MQPDEYTEPWDDYQNNNKVAIQKIAQLQRYTSNLINDQNEMTLILLIKMLTDLWAPTYRSQKQVIIAIKAEFLNRGQQANSSSY